MRCTRCDGLAVPQAVGIDSEDRVVFGWCLQCLADRGCKLVETSSRGRWRFSSAITDPAIKVSRRLRSPVDRTAIEAERSRRMPVIAAFETEGSQRVLTLVASMLLIWGLVLLAAGLWIALSSSAQRSPLGNGTPVLLITGGVMTTLMGVTLILLATRRNWHPGAFSLGLVSWLSLLSGIVMLTLGAPRTHDPSGVRLLAGACLSVIATVIAWLGHRYLLRKSEAGQVLVIQPTNLEVGGKRAERKDAWPSL